MSDSKKFTDLDLIKPIARAVAQKGYKTPTPIQARCIPELLKGRDLLGCAQTGTGKTAAFALPVLQNMQKSGARKHRIRTLVMTPTRELAAQIHESFQTYGRGLSLRSTVIFGGVPQKAQEKALRHGPDILVATPGRLLDLMGQKFINLKHVEYFILDEADRMLDMGFIHDVRRVIDVLPARRQSLFFSATMPPAVTALADRMLTDPVRVDVAPKTMTADRIDQTLMFVDKGDKRKLLEMLLMDTAIHRALVFSRTKHGADRICRDLVRADVAAGAIHGNKSQNARTRALAAFKSGKYRVLVATDIAARGIDVDGVSHVINFDLPNESESYVHRIGRTARAGKAGKAISFCAGDEMGYLREIQKLIKRQIPMDRDHSFHSEEASRGMENGVPALSPGQKKARQQAGQARRRKELKAGTARPARGSRQGQGGGPRRYKGGSGNAKASAPSKNRRRRPRRSAGK
ncbi:MAG: DEAD/DEAH box helicase [Phycisphaerae bacterium]|nr:DEAD/DEAH box helicase [Phycisphaerae bacterium]